MRTARSGFWDRADLIRRVTKALDFAQLKLRAIARGGAVLKDGTASTPASRWHADQKAVAETAMLLWCVAPVRGADRAIAERLAVATDSLVPLARDETILSAICADPGQADAYAVAHIVLRCMDFPDKDFDEVLLAAWGAQDAFRPEQPPYRRLEREWLARMLGWDARRRDAGLLASSMPGRPLDILTASTFDLYAFTHALMFASDFGLSRPRLPRGRAAILADADAALAASLDATDFDLSAELALSRPLLGASWSAAAAFAFRLLADVEDREGFLPVLGMDLAQHRALPAEMRSDHLLAHSYHSTYVMGFLCAVALRDGYAPPARFAPMRGVSSAGAADAVLHLFDGTAAASCWERPMRALREPERDALAPFALAILLRRAGARGDLARVRRALEVAVEFGVADGPVPLQAASLLRRSQCFDTMRRRRPEIRDDACAAPSAIAPAATRARTVARPFRSAVA